MRQHILSASIKAALAADAIAQALANNARVAGIAHHSAANAESEQERIAREAALVLPRKQAMRDIERDQKERFAHAMLTALELHTGQSITTTEQLEALESRVYVVAGPDPEDPEVVGDLVLLDGQAILFAGPVGVQEVGDELRANRVMVVFPPRVS
jgi:hypothetical protein